MKVVRAKGNADLLAIEVLWTLPCELGPCFADNFAQTSSTIGLHFNGIPFVTTVGRKGCIWVTQSGGCWTVRPGMEWLPKCESFTLPLQGTT